MYKKKIFFLLLLISSYPLIASEKSFQEFTTKNYFAPIQEEALNLNVVCRKNFDDKGKKKYYELLFYNNNKNVFDLNQHFRAVQVGHKNLKIPFYSFTVWNWFQSIGIESKKNTFITTTEQSTIRRSELVSPLLVKSIIDSSKFKIYFHYLKDNTKSSGLFKVLNIKELNNCFESDF